LFFEFLVSVPALKPTAKVYYDEMEIKYLPKRDKPKIYSHEHDL